MKKIFYIIILIACLSAFAGAAATVSPLDNDKAGLQETSVGDLTADALRAYAGTDIAFLSATDMKKGGTVPAGEINSEDITNLAAYPEDSVTVMKLTGEKIMRALNKSLLMYPNPYMGFLQVSGITVTFSPEKGVKDKIVSVKIKNQPLDMTKEYTTAMPKSLANGALGYWKVWSKDSDKISEKGNIVDAINNYLAANEKLNYSKQSRIIAQTEEK